MSLSRDQMMRITEWLYFYDGTLARAAHEDGIKMGHISPPPPRFYDRLESPTEVEAALLKWKGLEGNYMIYPRIVARGTELGMDFTKQSEQKNQTAEVSTVAEPDWSVSPVFFWYGGRDNLPKSFEKAASLDPKVKHNAYVILYDSWSLANRGQEPDFDSFPPDAREVWKDLSGLGPIADDHHVSIPHEE